MSNPKVKRYDLCIDGEEQKLIISENGDYVAYDEHEDIIGILKNEILELEKLVEELTK